MLYEAILLKIQFQCGRNKNHFEKQIHMMSYIKNALKLFQSIELLKSLFYYLQKILVERFDLQFMWVKMAGLFIFNNFLCHTTLRTVDLICGKTNSNSCLKLFCIFISSRVCGFENVKFDKVAFGRISTLQSCLQSLTAVDYIFGDKAVKSIFLKSF